MSTPGRPQGRPGDVMPVSSKTAVIGPETRTVRTVPRYTLASRRYRPAVGPRRSSHAPIHDPPPPFDRAHDVLRGPHHLQPRSHGPRLALRPEREPPDVPGDDR